MQTSIIEQNVPRRQRKLSGAVTKRERSGENRKDLIWKRPIIIFRIMYPVDRRQLLHTIN